MEHPIIHPSAVPARPQTTLNATESTHAKAGSHNADLLLGIGAILLGWSIVAMWLLLFISCVVGTRVFINMWL